MSGLIDLRGVDPTMIKLFKLAQLSLEYMVDQNIRATSNFDHMNNDLTTAQAQLSILRKKYDGSVAELSGIRREVRVLRKTVYAYQLVAKMPGNAASANKFVSEERSRDLGRASGYELIRADCIDN